MTKRCVKSFDLNWYTHFQKQREGANNFSLRRLENRDRLDSLLRGIKDKERRHNVLIYHSGMGSHFISFPLRSREDIHMFSTIEYRVK